MSDNGRHSIHVKPKLFTIRKIAKSGNSRYISISKLVPLDWIAVKIVVEKLDKGVCILKLEQIK